MWVYVTCNGYDCIGCLAQNDLAYADTELVHKPEPVSLYPISSFFHVHPVWCYTLYSLWRRMILCSLWYHLRLPMVMMQAYLYCWNTRGVQINVFVVKQVGIITKLVCSTFLFLHVMSHRLANDLDTPC